MLRTVPLVGRRSRPVTGGRRDGRVECVELVRRLGKPAEFPAVGAGQHERDACAHEVGGQAPGDTNGRTGECRFLAGAILRRPSGGHGCRASVGAARLGPQSGGDMGPRTADFTLDHHKTRVSNQASSGIPRAVQS